MLSNRIHPLSIKHMKRTRLVLVSLPVFVSNSINFNSKTKEEQFLHGKPTVIFYELCTFVEENFDHVTNVFVY